ncbi:MAG: glycerophosphodiester phosphodiesterase [Opitutales bacterium]
MKLIGHRGSAGTQPENTLAAFRAAWASRADGIECDVRLTRDRQLAVIHDPTLERTFGLPKAVASTTFETLEALTSKHADGPLPLLEAVLRAAQPDHWCFIELKTNAADPAFVPADYAAALERSLAAGAVPRAKIRLIAFDPFLLLSLKTALPDLRSLWLPLPQLNPAALETFWRSTVLSQLDGIGHTRTLGPLPGDFLRHLETSGKERSVWTVNDSKEARLYQENNYDFLTTDFPAKFAQAIQS